MNIDEIKRKNLIIFESVSGSRAYGLDTPASDTDIKGVFLLPKKDFYGLDYISQISNSTNDIVYYEFNRFMELLSLNNPNILELLSAPKDTILYKHPFLNEIKPELILSKLCKNTFGKYALSQIKKAKGLKKKIVNPIDKKRKTLLSFCYVNYENGSVLLPEFLKINNYKQKNCGLTKIPHMKNMYALFYNEKADYRGIIKNELSNDISLSSVPKGEKQVALVYFNKEEYSRYCKEYKEYWEWVKNRNEARYQSTQKHGKKYDAKNMMHTFRLLQMAIEIAKEKKIKVKRDDREFLLNIKNGKYEYEDLLIMAKEKQEEMEEAFAKSDLQEKPDRNAINELTYKIRDRFYRER